MTSGEPGHSLWEVDRIAKLVPNRLNITLADALKEEPKLREIEQQWGADDGS